MGCLGGKRDGLPVRWSPNLYFPAIRDLSSSGSGVRSWAGVVVGWEGLSAVYCAVVGCAYYAVLCFSSWLTCLGSGFLYGLRMVAWGVVWLVVAGLGVLLS